MIGGNTPPTITGTSPVSGKNFDGTAGGVAFNINDDASAPLDNIKLTLNGVVYSNGSPGVTITPPDRIQPQSPFHVQQPRSECLLRGQHPSVG